MTRMLVCGGRDFTDYGVLALTLDDLCQANGWVMEPSEDGNWLPKLDCVIHGGARGADLLADRWAVSSYVDIMEFPADWGKHGRAAGPIRNQQMLDEGKPDIVVAFPGGRGTADMAARARKAGIRVIEVA